MAEDAKATAAEAKDVEPAETPGDPNAISVALSGIEKARGAAKWLIGALGAVAVVLVAGTQLSSIGEAEGWRLAIAAACAVTGLSALGVGLFATFRLMTPLPLSLDQLANRGWDRSNDPSIKFLRANESVFQGEATNVVDLRAKIRAAEDERDAAVKQQDTDPGDKDLEAKAKAADDHLHRLDDVAISVTEHGRYAAFMRQLMSWERRMAVVLVLVGFALVGFAWAANPPDDDDQKNDSAVSAPDLRGVTMEDVDLSRTNLSGVDFSYASLTGVNLRGAITDGAKWEGVVWNDVTCVDGTNSDDAGDTCDDHLAKD